MGLVGSAWVSTLRAAPTSSASGRRPSFVVILMDDAGWGDWGSNWAETTETSFLDRLAKRALRCGAQAGFARVRELHLS